MKLCIRILIYFMALFLFISCNKKDEEYFQSEKPAIPVRVQKASLNHIKVMIPISGTLLCKNEVILKSKINGKIHFAKGRDAASLLGEKVRKGELIAQVKDEALNIQLKSAKIDLDRIKVEYDYTQKLADEGLAAAVDLIKKEAELKRAQASYDLAKENLEKSKVQSPMNGEIIEVESLVEDQEVFIGDKICTINNLQELKIYAHISEKDALHIEPGMDVEIDYERVEAKKIFAKASNVSSVVDKESRTVEIEIAINNKDNQLKPGIFMTGNIIVEQLENVLTIPLGSVIEKNGSYYIYTIKSDWRGDFAVLREVRLGASDKEKVHIRLGLKEGDMVITHGLSEITDGALVKVSQ